MQQLLYPDLEQADLEQANSGLPYLDLPRQDAVWQQAQQGDIQAIAALLQQQLSQKLSSDIIVQGNRRGDRVGVLLEATTLPPQQTLLPWIHQELSQLKPAGIAQIEVYGRISGQRQTQWQTAIALKLQSETYCADGNTRIDAKANIPVDFDADSDANANADTNADTNADANDDSNTDIVPLSEWLQQGVVASSQPDRQSANPPLSVETATLSQFLRFAFTAEETALIPLEGIKEILKIPTAAILPVPQMPVAVLGVYHCRGSILWLIDLSVQIGSGNSAASRSRLMSSANPPLGQQAAGFSLSSAAAQVLTAIVIEVEQQTLGLVVPDIFDIEAHSPQQIQPVPANLFPPQRSPFIQGYLNASNSPVLSLEAIMNDPRFQIYR